MSFFDKVKKLMPKKYFKKNLKFGRNFFGNIAGAVGSYYGGPAGGALGSKIGDSLKTGDSAERNAQKESDREYARSLADQERFARDSLQWRVEDARKAGLSPLAALGFSPPQFIPPQPDYGGGYYANDEYGLSDMGQDIGRAIAAGQTERERRKAENTVMSTPYDDAILRRTNLENDALVLDIQYKQARLNALLAGRPPAGPVTNSAESQGDLNQIVVTAKRRPYPAFPAVTQGMDPVIGKDYQLVDTDYGVVRIPTPYFKQASEDNILLEGPWTVRNQLIPAAEEIYGRARRQTEKDWNAFKNRWKPSTRYRNY